jgi:hypothetical protein
VTPARNEIPTSGERQALYVHLQSRGSFSPSGPSSGNARL